MSINVRSILGPQKPLTAISMQALFCLFAEPGRICPFNSWSAGSIETFEHTSDSREAVRSRTSLCRNVGKPPLWQERACSMVKDLPHTLHHQDLLRSPPIMQGHSISKSPFVEGEAMLPDWKCTQPRRGSFLLSKYNGMTKVLG